MKLLSRELVNLAWECVQLDDKGKQIEFGKHTDYQGDLHLFWEANKFQAYLVVYSDPHTTGGFFYDPPETHWREEEDEFEAVKIRDVADWLKRDWGFELSPTIPRQHSGL